MLTAINPLTRCVNLRVGLNGSYDGRSGDFDFADSFYDLFQCGPHITLALGEEPKGVSVAIDTGAISQLVLFRDRGWAAPVDEVALDLFPLWVGTDLAFGRVAPRIYRCFWPFFHI